MMCRSDRFHACAVCTGISCTQSCVQLLVPLESEPLTSFRQIVGQEATCLCNLKTNFDCLKSHSSGRVQWPLQMPSVRIPGTWKVNKETKTNESEVFELALEKDGCSISSSFGSVAPADLGATLDRPLYAFPRVYELPTGVAGPQNQAPVAVLKSGYERMLGPADKMASTPSSAVMAVCALSSPLL
jgi:hypothetical protein